MRRTIHGLLVLAMLFGGTALFRRHHNPLVVTLVAQTLPIARQLCWDDTTVAADGVTSFVPTQDGTALASVGPTVFCAPVTIASLGTHTFSVAAVNQWASTSSPVLTVNVIAPKAPANPRIQ